MMSELITITHLDPRVARVALNNPAKKNALSIAMRDEISDAFDQLTADNVTSTIIITGAGTVFSSGFDLKEFANPDPEHQERLWASSDRFHHAVLQCPIPVIAAVNGPALAGGFDLAVLADLRVASTTARFAHVEQPFGDVVYRPLREIVGGGVARDLVLTGRSIDAREAAEVGLVNRVVAPEQLDVAAYEMAQHITKAPHDILLRTKAKIIARTAIDAGIPTLEL